MQRWLRSTPRTAALPACLLILASAGCGAEGSDDGAGDDGDDGSDDGTIADAGPGQADSGTGEDRPDADVEVECPPGRLGALGAVEDAQAFQEPFDPADPEGAQTRTLVGSFGTTRITMVLIDGRGAFARGAVAPGIHELGAPESDLGTCGACIQLGVITDEAAFPFLPTAGTITLDSVDGTLTGTVADLAFQELDPETGQLVADGCTATAEGFSFDAPLLVR